jgi:RNA polymerase sigma factor (TIGR02999 family)
VSDQQFASLMNAAENGDAEARHQLFAALYHELHGIARRELSRNRSALTLGATTLLHEAYLNLGEREGMLYPDRARFLAYASRAMRGLIIDYARGKRALKRGGAFVITSLPEELPEAPSDPEALRRLGDAIDQLATVEPRLAQVVDLKYFGGFSFSDIAAMWGISERTVQRDWGKARLFLYRALAEEAPANASEAHELAPAC